MPASRDASLSAVFEKPRRRESGSSRTSTSRSTPAPTSAAISSSTERPSYPIVKSFGTGPHRTGSLRPDHAHVAQVHAVDVRAWLLFGDTGNPRQILDEPFGHVDASEVRVREAERP